ncbi:MAG: SGNH/GDSL hydrolase family protein [bacterium]
MMRRLGGALLKGFRALRTAWDIVGITLMIVLVIVVGIFAVSAVHGKTPSDNDRADHPYHAEPWFRKYLAEYEASLLMEWRPYVYWRRHPMVGDFVNVDTAGIRRTVQPAAGTLTPRRIYFLGGSTMWGTGHRDAMTIPSQVATALAAQGVNGVEITNLAETGYVFTQEFVQLFTLLRAGARPDLVVFYDGINDAVSSATSPTCGLPQNETRRRFEFALGRVLNQRGLREFRAMIRTARDRLAAGPIGASAGAPIDTVGLAHSLVDCYARTATPLEALSRLYGFRVLYFWQPTPRITTKPLTTFEVAVLDTLSKDPMHRMLRSLDRHAVVQMDSAMKPIAGDRFQNMGGLFNGDTSTVWLDFIGHVTERSNTKIAGAMVGPIVKELAAGKH